MPTTPAERMSMAVRIARAWARDPAVEIALRELTEIMAIHDGLEDGSRDPHIEEMAFTESSDRLIQAYINLAQALSVRLTRNIAARHLRRGDVIDRDYGTLYVEVAEPRLSDPGLTYLLIDARGLDARTRARLRRDSTMGTPLLSTDPSPCFEVPNDTLFTVVDAVTL